MLMLDKNPDFFFYPTTKVAESEHIKSAIVIHVCSLLPTNGVQYTHDALQVFNFLSCLTTEKKRKKNRPKWMQFSVLTSQRSQFLRMDFRCHLQTGFGIFQVFFFFSC